MKEINKTTRYLFVPFAFQDKAFISNYNMCHKGLKIYLDDTGYDDEYHNDCFYVYFDKLGHFIHPNLPCYRANP